MSKSIQLYDYAGEEGSPIEVVTVLTELQYQMRKSSMKTSKQTEAQRLQFLLDSRHFKGERK